MPPKPLPPLPALRVFEAAARQLSFKAAAEELCVTPSSVSHQIRKLEAWLGVALFIRFNREVALTQDGRQLFGAVARALGDIAESCAAIDRQRTRGDGQESLVVAANSGFIDCWLNARLPEFHAAHPEIDLVLGYGEDPAEYRHRDADVAISYGAAEPPAPHVVLLRRCMEFPVCSPDYRRGGRRLERVGDLRGAVLLHEHDRIGWRRWLRDAGEAEAEVGAGPIFQNSATVFDRVQARGGVALGDDLVAADRLFAGRMVKPLSFVRLSDWSTYLVTLRKDRSPAGVRAFCDWLVDALQRHERETEILRRACPYPEGASG